MNTPLATETSGEGFAYFRWVCLVAPAELTYYAGLLPKSVWIGDWVQRALRNAVYVR